jgi:hypothetical protein
MIRHNVAIGADFVVGDELTVYEWCMIYTDRHPGVAAKHATAEAQRERMQYLGAIAPLVSGPTTATVAGQDFEVDTREHYRITNAVYQELATAIQTGSLEPKRRAYLDDRPGELDPTLCVLEAAPILAIAERRGDGGEVIQKLLAERRQPPASPPKRRSGYTGGLAAFMAQLIPRTVAALSDDQIARLFVDRVETQVKAGKSTLKLPELRHIANQVAKLRAKDPGVP